MSNKNLYTNGLKSWQILNVASITESKATVLTDEYWSVDFAFTGVTDIGPTQPWNTQTISNAGDSSYVGELMGSGSSAYFQFAEEGVYAVSIRFRSDALGNSQYMQLSFNDVSIIDPCDLFTIFTGSTVGIEYTTMSGLIVADPTRQYTIRALVVVGYVAPVPVTGCMVITRLK